MIHETGQRERINSAALYRAEKYEIKNYSWQLNGCTKVFNFDKIR